MTATVENLSLITASILSKKLAAGLGWLVLDVKCGNGAFMDDMDKARGLAESLVRVANGAGTKTVALITDMNQSLASAVGNAVEVRNAVEFLNGTDRDQRLEEVTVQLVNQMVAIATDRKDLEKIDAEVRSKLDDGTAALVFGKMVSALGGPDDFMDRYDHYLPKAPIVRDVLADEAGYLCSMQTRDVGVAVVAMGGGRRTREDEIDHAVGLSNLVSIGAEIKPGSRLFTVHANDETMFEQARSSVIAALGIGSQPPAPQPIVIERIG